MGASEHPGRMPRSSTCSVFLLIALKGFEIAEGRRSTITSLVNLHTWQAGVTPDGVVSVNDLGPTGGSKKPENITKKKEEQKHHLSATLQCGVTVQVHSGTDKYEDCPADCPYFAQDRSDDLFCTFVCVPAEDCKKYNPNKPIADEIHGSRTCRGPMVQHCRDFALDGTDSCVKCQTFYVVGPDGQCYYSHWIKLWCLIILFVSLVLFIVVWVMDLICRPVTNERGLREGLAFRSRQKIHTPKIEGQTRTLYPIDTNLCKTEVAGAGMLLHFNFQMLIMFWAFFVACVWLCLGFFIDGALFVLGTRKFGTPRHNCILVAWGYETQHRLMWTKVTFLMIVYTVSFLGALIHGVRQLRMFQVIDAKTKSMKDFCAIMSGLPAIPGEASVEASLKDSVAQATGQSVVGVSVAWIYREQEETVMNAITKDLRDREDEVDPPLPAPEGPHTTGMNPLRKKLFEMEQNIFADAELEEEADYKPMLLAMNSSEYAFVVFETEDAKDSAVELTGSSGIQVGPFTGLDETATVYLQSLSAEPDTVNWVAFGHSSMAAQVFRLLQGFGCIFLALVFWTVVFYLPYAWSIFSFNYANGAQPPFIYSLVFTMVVVVGNAIMYEVCARVSDFVGFRFRDNREACYMILYTIACMFNVGLDLVTTFFFAYYVMTGLGFRTYDGRLLSEVTAFTERFETYAMQRALAENTYVYAFPSTFLIPFLIEPIITVYLPLKLSEWVVRSHPEMVRGYAESYLVAFEFDMGRYADILLNMFLGILIFYFPGGYTHTLFLGMVVSHMVIYAFDHWRLIRAVPALKVVSMDVDWWSQLMFIPCCSMMMSCMIFKANCKHYGYCIKGNTLIESCTAGAVIHAIIHFLLLMYLVPAMGKSGLPDPNEGMEYRTVCEREAVSWFTANPVHCLRSKYVHMHNPPCRYASVGKEHLLQVNAEIGCYFEDEAAEAEDFKKGLNLKAGFKAGLGKLGSMGKKFSFKKKKGEEAAKDDKIEEEPEDKQASPAEPQEQPTPAEPAASST